MLDEELKRRSASVPADAGAGSEFDVCEQVRFADIATAHGSHLGTQERGRLAIEEPITPARHVVGRRASRWQSDPLSTEEVEPRQRKRRNVGALRLPQVITLGGGPAIAGAVPKPRRPNNGEPVVMLDQFDISQCALAQSRSLGNLEEVDAGFRSSSMPRRRERRGLGPRREASDAIDAGPLLLAPWSVPSMSKPTSHLGTRKPTFSRGCVTASAMAISNDVS